MRAGPVAHLEATEKHRAEFVDEDVGGDRALDETAKACADERRAAAPHAGDGGRVNGRGCDGSVRAEG
jgi:hypothetical protein